MGKMLTDDTTIVPQISLTASRGGIESTVVGVVIDGWNIVYLELVGQAQSVRALWAGLAGNKTPDALDLSNGRSVYSPDGVCLKRIEKVLPNGLVNLAMVHPLATAIGAGDPFYRIVFPGSTLPPHGFYDILNSKLILPIKREWEEWLWERGQTHAGESAYYSPVQKLESYGHVSGYKIFGDERKEEWRKLILEITGNKATTYSYHDDPLRSV